MHIILRFEVVSIVWAAYRQAEPTSAVWNTGPTEGMVSVNSCRGVKPSSLSTPPSCRQAEGIYLYAGIFIYRSYPTVAVANRNT